MSISITMTGAAETLVGNPTGSSATVTDIDAGQIPGTSTNDDASAGNVGEYISAGVLSTSPVSLTNNTVTVITSISLTAGDWDVHGNASTAPDSGTVQTVVIGGINTSSSSLPTQGASAGIFQFSNSAGTQSGLSTFMQSRLSLVTTTTVYLLIDVNFTVNTCGAYGFIGARRMR